MSFLDHVCTKSKNHVQYKPHEISRSLLFCTKADLNALIVTHMVKQLGHLELLYYHVQYYKYSSVHLTISYLLLMLDPSSIDI